MIVVIGTEHRRAHMITGHLKLCIEALKRVCLLVGFLDEKEL